jgi:hypothetical protein
MNKTELQLVSFEQAKRLKTLGFCWETDHYFHENISEKVILRALYGEKYHYCESHCFIPSIALALQWIRDERDIPCGVTVGMRKKIFASYYYKGKLVKLSNFDSFENAESALLDELLRILEINE